MTVPKVLLVDDEVNILKALQRLLIHENFEIVSTSSPFEALHLASKEEFMIVISDHRMPHMEGTNLLRRIKEIAPAAIRILLTGYADLNAATAAINEGEVYRFLSKPWEDEELLQIIKQAVQQFEMDKDQKLAYVHNQELKESNQALTEKNLQQVFHNRHLCEELNQSYLIAAQALAQSMKCYDTGLWNHSLCVKHICQKIAKLIGLPPESALQLEVAGLLHDIGKTGMPKTLLRKPEAELQPKEQELLHNHSFNGYSIVKMIPFFQEAANLIQCHHEAFNGTGYPRGLKDGEIPGGAKIIAVADAYAKQKRGSLFVMDDSAEEALAYLESQSGLQFDPQAIHLLKECLVYNEQTQKNSTQQQMANYWQQTFATDKNQFSVLPPNPVDPPSPVHVKQSIQSEPSKKTDSDTKKIVPQSPEANTLPSWTIEAEPSLSNDQLASIEPQENWEQFFLPTWDIDSLEIEPVATEPQQTNQQIPEEKIRPNPSSNVSLEYKSSNSVVNPTTEPNPSSPIAQPVSNLNPKAYYPQGSSQLLKQAYSKTKPQKYREIVIPPTFLCAGMVLSRDLVSSQGATLLPKGSVIHPDQLDTIKSSLKRNGLMEIYVLKPY